MSESLRSHVIIPLFSKLISQSGGEERVRGGIPTNFWQSTLNFPSALGYVFVFDAVSDLMHNRVAQRPDFKSAVRVVKMVLNTQCYQYLWLTM